MKIAVLSDIHGFSIALECVLADIAAEPGIGQIIAAGDLCETGPDPRGVIDILSSRGIAAVQGNTDRDLAMGSRSSAAFRNTLDQIGEAGIDYLDSLPFELRLSPPGSLVSDDDLLVVHANPFDQDRAIRPDASEREVREILGDTRAAAIAFGHIHISFIRNVGSQLLVDVSAVGNPKDEDLLARWGLLTWNDEERQWSAEIRYVDYPIEETTQQILASSLPNPEKVLRKLLHASYK